MERVSRIWGIAGPVVKTAQDFSVSVYEAVRIGFQGLSGEVIRITGDKADIQVYENTDGLAVGEPVIFTGEPLSVELAPGLLGGVYDGIGRPLRTLGREGVFLKKGENIPIVDHQRTWRFTPCRFEGEMVGPGDVLGHVRECDGVLHLISLPPTHPGGELSFLTEEGDYPIDHRIAVVSGRDVSMVQRWNVRRMRPVLKKLPLSLPLLTGQRALDTLFPLALGGAAVMAGGFGTGKTVAMQSIAKWCNVHVIVYIGCGERGSEMAEVLEDFPMDRTVLIANTSNMPVAAREAGVCLGMTIGEYYRDMGLNVAVMTDSVSRWAEALREIGGRLEEVPGEEGYPAYLDGRLARYCERAGRAASLGKPYREGSVTVINSVSPPGGDFSEPVTQAGLRFSGTFWALDKTLAQQRHFPSVNWNQSYSLYVNELEEHYKTEFSPDWPDLINFLKERLSSEKELQNLVHLAGRDGLSDEDRWTLAFAHIIKAVYLRQDAFDPSDAFTSPKKQGLLLSSLRELYRTVAQGLPDKWDYDALAEEPILRDLVDLRLLKCGEFSAAFSSWIRSLTEKIRKSPAVNDNETL